MARVGVALVVALCAATAGAQVQGAMAFEAYVTDVAGTPIEGEMALEMAIWTQELGGVKLWTTGTFVAISQGWAAGTVGGGEDPIPVALFADYPETWLEITVLEPPETPIALPRVPLLAVPYAFHAQSAASAATVPDGSITQAKLAVGVAALPVGAVIDWWRPNPATPVPDGFQICDGGEVIDPDSPLNGETLPNLIGRFTRGVSPTDIGVAGGESTHEHELLPPPHTHTIDHKHPVTTLNAGTAGQHTHTTTVPAHDHTVSVGHTHAPATSEEAGDHSHAWATHDPSGHWTSGDGAAIDEPVQTISGNGSDGAALNVAPSAQVTLSTSSVVAHAHTVAVPALDESRTTDAHPEATHESSGGGAHSHTATVKVPALGTDDITGPATGPLAATKPVTTLPPYIGLLKIMRIR